MSAIATGSPFWLQVDGVWCHLEGVTAGMGVATERPRSGFITVGGTRHTQQARRGPRTWSMSVPLADADAMRLLEVACEAGEVWLLDETSARVNMLRTVDTAGTVGSAVDVVQGLPVRRSVVGTALFVSTRPGVTTTLAAWTTTTTPLAVVSRNGVDVTTLLGGAGVGLRRYETPITTSQGGLLKILCASDISALQVYEGSTAPVWSPGRGTPCRVSVHDPDRTLRMIRGGSMYADLSFTLEEVG